MCIQQENVFLDNTYLPQEKNLHFPQPSPTHIEVSQPKHPVWISETPIHRQISSISQEKATGLHHSVHSFTEEHQLSRTGRGRDDASHYRIFHDMTLKKVYREMSVNAKFGETCTLLFALSFCSVVWKESYLHAASWQTSICKIRAPCKIGYELQGRNSSKKNINNLCRCKMVHCIILCKTVHCIILLLWYFGTVLPMLSTDSPRAVQTLLHQLTVWELEFQEYNFTSCNSLNDRFTVSSTSSTLQIHIAFCWTKLHWIWQLWHKSS